MAHCQICEREIKNSTGLMAHHGYQRPGSGWQTESCMGARNLSYEESRDVIPKAIDYLRLQISGIHNNIQEIKEKSLPIPMFFYAPAFGNNPLLDSTHPQYQRRQEEYINNYESQIRMIEREIERLQKRYDNWKLQVDLTMEEIREEVSKMLPGVERGFNIKIKGKIYSLKDIEEAVIKNRPGVMALA